jgi:cbb3-type cytochrome oxidase subunit 3
VSGARKLLLSGIALTALLALVAIASRARRPGGGSGGGSADSAAVIGQYVAAIGFIVLPLGALLIVWALAYSRRQQALAGKTSWRRTLGATGLLFGLLLVASLSIDKIRDARQSEQPAVTGPLRATPGQQPGNEADRRRNVEPGWLPFLVVGSLAFAIAVTAAAAVAYRRRHRAELDEEARLARALDEVLADTLEDLHAERDPRKAVIRAYARMEQTFAAYRVPRNPAETPLEYVARVLDKLSVSGFAVRRLTLLFERAKFSTHVVEASMKDDAIEALAGLRAELEYGREEAAA